MLWGEKFIAALGVKNIGLIETDDAILILNLEKAQGLSELVDQLPEMLTGGTKFKSFKAHPTADDQNIIEYKPWGQAVYLNTDGRRYLIKKMRILPGQQLSLQYHRYREEHWLIVEGDAEVTVGSRIQFYTAPQYIHIPVGQIHRIANVGVIELVLLEVQRGDWLSENDIVRLSDDYGRRLTDDEI